ncbi:MAG: cupin domain-containing protein [Beijerinckiaceae bacterium]
MSERSIFISSTEVPLLDAPIQPDWIVSGSPRARMAELSRSRDGAAVSVIWDFTAGEFDWRFDVDEWVQIVEGSAEIRDDDGNWRTLAPSSVVLFRAGVVSRWRVSAYVRKHAICRVALPVSMGFALRALVKLRALIAQARTQGVATAA